MTSVSIAATLPIVSVNPIALEFVPLLLAMIMLTTSPASTGLILAACALVSANAVSNVRLMVGFAAPEPALMATKAVAATSIVEP